MEDSGLRGLGGAGFPAGRKWKLVAAEPAPRLMAINIDEGEPGTFKDRYYLERDPHRFLEGAIIAAWAVGIDAVYIYLRDEYHGCRAILSGSSPALRADPPCAIPRFHLRRGAGAYICGEESAMIESIEGKRGEPRLRPPYVAQVGLFGRPTLEHNMETLHWVRDILEKGPGLVCRPRAERPQGTALVLGERARQETGCPPRARRDHAAGADRRVLRRHARGPHALRVSAGRRVRRDPAGVDGEHPARLRHARRRTAASSDRRRSSCCPTRTRRPRAARNVMKFFADESCGQCTPCRVGTEKALQLMNARGWDEPLLQELSQAMMDASICGLGQAAPNPVLSVLKYFPAGSRADASEEHERACDRDVHAEREDGRRAAPTRRILADRGRARHRDPAPLLHGGHARRRQLPHVHGRDQGRARAGAVLLPLSQGRHGGHDQQRARRDQPEDVARAAAVGCARDVLHAATPSSISGRRRCAIGKPRFRARPQPAEDLSHPAMAVHLDACIQCKRCVRACREEQVNDVIGYAFRGGQSKIVFDLDDPDGRLDVRRLRRVRAGLPDRRADAGPRRREDRAGEDRRLGVPVLRRRLPAHLQRQGQQDPLRAGQGRPRQLEPPVREGPVRLRLRPASAPAHQAADPQAGRAEAQGLRRRSGELAGRFPRGDVGRSARRRGQRAAATSATPTASARSRASARRRARTKRRISSRSWCARASDPTTSITARASATPRASPR